MGKSILPFISSSNNHLFIHSVNISILSLKGMHLRIFAVKIL